MRYVRCMRRIVYCIPGICGMVRILYTGGTSLEAFGDINVFCAFYALYALYVL